MDRIASHAELLTGKPQIDVHISKKSYGMLHHHVKLFSQAGEFTFLGKLRSSLWDNAIYYTSYLLIAVILIIYIALQPGLHLTWGRTKAIAAAASNTWGLCLLVLMLGYGLVEVPRNLWLGSKRGHRLSQAYFRVSKLWTERSDAEGQLEEVLTSVEAAGKGVAGVLLRGYLDTIVSKVPTEMMERVRRRQGRQGAVEDDQQVTEQTLAKLHKQVLVALTAHKRTEAQWVEHIERVLWLEDNQRNLASFDKVFKRQTEPPNRGWLGFLINPTSEWYWRCLVQPRLFQTGAVVALIFSVVLTWSEVGDNAAGDLSLTFSGDPVQRAPDFVFDGAVHSGTTMQ